MNILDIIEKKKNKKELTKEEIDFTINNFVNGNIKDYQMSSLLMAIVINGMTDTEVFNLTDAMINSGDKMDLSMIEGIKVDKHSTGGIGDKTSLIVLPLAAACGVKIAKMSGRGLGFTSGTIDRLESIEGFKTSISEEDFINQVNEIGLSLVSQSKNLVPADKKIYALRDVTGTTESIPLIASSIMSKKLSSGADKILLDVKVGKGAFMKEIESAKKLARLMVRIGNNANKETVAMLTNMEYPLGYTIGNGLEVKEAIDTLLGKGEEQFLKLCIVEASYMVSLSKNISVSDAVEEVQNAYKKRLGYKKLEEFISAQGGNINKIDILEKRIPIISTKSGYLTNIDSLALAKLSNSFGAGRVEKEDKINHGVGIVLNKVYGEKVQENEVLAYLVTDKDIEPQNYESLFTIESEKPSKIKIIYDIFK